MGVLLVGLLAMMVSTTSHGFVSTPPSLTSSAFAFGLHKGSPTPATDRGGGRGISTVLSMAAAPPLIENWYVGGQGEVLGVVSNHPTLPDGTSITTSQLKDPGSTKDNKVVQTISGSSYRLGRGATPLIENWYIGGDGEVIGVVSDHPILRDGTAITTSPLKDSRSAKDNKVVQTASGSRYKLGRGAANAQPQPPPQRAGGRPSLPIFFNAGAADQPAAAGQSSADVGAAGQRAAAKPGWFGSRREQSAAVKPGPAGASAAEQRAAARPSWFNVGAAGQSAAARQGPADARAAAQRGEAEKRSAAKAKPNWFNVRAAGQNTAARQGPANARAAARSEEAKKIPAAKDFGLNGRTVGDGKYLLSGSMMTSTSGRSNIYSAYRSDSRGLPTGARLTVKISADPDRLARESRNYDKVTGGLFGGSFVRKVEYLPSAAGQGIAGGSALVLESGERNLRELMAARGRQGLEGKSLRQAAVALVQCIRAMHSSNLVWTDLKAENFVVVTDSMGDGSLAGVKGIDLESIVQKGTAPLDYSPEACPPEFADAYVRGYGDQFQVEESYDIWSFGMLMYELSTGRKYFAGLSPTEITRFLRADFVPKLDGVSDGRMRDLIGQCLQVEPRKRPSVAQVLFHPYFLTTGFASISV